jgi:monoamine oxidase
LHSGSVNVFAKLADQHGIGYETKPPMRRGHNGNGWLTDDENNEAEHAAFVEMRGAIEDAGKAGRDVSAAEIVDMNHRWIAVLRTGLAGEWGVDIPHVSTADDAAYRDTGENWPVRDGYGTLVARHAQGIPVELNTPVTAIEWDGPGVVVETASGAIDARTVVITVSTRMIQDERIAFSPALPDWKHDAYDAITLGNANKVAFKIDRRLLGEGHSTIWIQVSPAQGMWFQMGAFGKDLANGYLAGALGEATEQEGEAAMLTLGRQALAMAYGSDILKAIQVQACTRWQHEPYIRGAYGAARPGKAHLRRDLATPLDGKLFFAGEAVSLDFFSTCHGAHLTGIDAVDRAARSLKS